MNRTTSTILFATGGILLGALGTFLLPIALSFGSKPTAPVLSVGEDGLVYETFVMESPIDMVSATHDGKKPIAAAPEGIPLLDEERIKAGFALVVKLRNVAGEIVGFASEQEVVAPGSNIQQGRMEMDTTWTLTLPGRGTIFLAERENAAQFAREAVMPALLFDKPLTEPMTFVTTAGPAADGTGLIVGGTGEFHGITGHFVEVTHLRGFSKQTGIDGTIELQLAYAPIPD